MKRHDFAATVDRGQTGHTGLTSHLVRLTVASSLRVRRLDCESGQAVCVGRSARPYVIVGDYRHEGEFGPCPRRKLLAFGPASSEFTFMPFKGKENLPDAFDDLISDLDLDQVRIRRPSRFTFLCGGKIGADKDPPGGLRDYLVRVRPIERRLGHPIVLAESAQQLYRETSYHDLITFEEDIAKIAAIVLVISESAGALAELGAFSSSPDIRKALRILISEEHHAEESFVRYGPVERIINDDRARVGVYPWRNHKKGSLIKSSVSGEYSSILRFIKEHVEQTPETNERRLLGSSSIFFDILWILYLTHAASPTVLYSLVRRLHPAASDDEIKNKLYAMRVAGWTASVPHGGQDFHLALSDTDPFEYAFRSDVKGKDVFRRRSDVRKALRKIEKPHTTVIQRVNKLRRDSK